MWWTKVKIRKKFPTLRLEAGEYIMNVVDEPKEPIPTRYGLRLPLTVKLENSGEIYTWLIPYKEEVTEGSLIGRLGEIAKRWNGLKNLRLKVNVWIEDSRRKYNVEVLEDGSRAQGV
ncbi:MAG: hypothetical protein LZ174_08910 [Thaumarchaeota archaeon]|jgi:hypothetical protein|nr:hypothetical protein [Candidatus Geocrenenecus arthurdayi]